MPKVGGRSFPYTTQGMRDAAEYAANLDTSMDNTYRHGGSIDMYGEGGRVKKKRKKPKPDPKRMGYAKPVAKANVAKKGIDGRSRVKTKTKYC